MAVTIRPVDAMAVKREVEEPEEEEQQQMGMKIAEMDISGEGVVETATYDGGASSALPSHSFGVDRSGNILLHIRLQPLLPSLLPSPIPSLPGSPTRHQPAEALPQSAKGVSTSATPTPTPRPSPAFAAWPPASPTRAPRPAPTLPSRPSPRRGPSPGRPGSARYCASRRPAPPPC